MESKSCANPRCTCPAEAGKEFCSAQCRVAVDVWDQSRFMV